MTALIPYGDQGSMQRWHADSAAILDLRGELISQPALDAIASELHRVKLAKATFIGSISFERIVWPDTLVDFTEVTFQGAATFAGSALGPNTRLNFSRVSFEQDAVFRGVHFGTRNSMFDRVTFGADCDFYGATLAPRARFDRCAIHGTATISKMTVGNDLTQFVDCVFDGVVLAHEMQLPRNAAVQFERCSFAKRIQASAPLGGGAVTANECVPPDALDILTTPTGSGFFDPSTDRVVFFLKQDGHEFSTPNMANLVYLLHRVQPLDALITRRDGQDEFMCRVSVAGDTFSIANAASDATAVNVSLNEATGFLEQVHARRQVPDLAR